MRRLIEPPVCGIKIGQSMVTTDQPSSRQFVAAITAMGREIGIDVTAEGGEDVRTLDVLRSVGCVSYQGHPFSEALSEVEFIYRHRLIWNRSSAADHLGLSACAFAATTIC